MSTPAKITFHELQQSSQEIVPGESTKKHMQATAIFTLETGGKTYKDMSVAIQQPYGTDFATEPIEVQKIKGSYVGNWNHNQFCDVVEDYYRNAIGSQGKAIRVGPNATVTLRVNTIGFSKSYELQIPE